MDRLSRITQDLQELRALLMNSIVSKEWYYRELDEMIKNSSNKEEIQLINKYKDLDN